ncbi:hypothetical protein GCM10027598_29030 [Amycolatopsis oliviviridis]
MDVRADVGVAEDLAGRGDQAGEDFVEFRVRRVHKPDATRLATLKRDSRDQGRNSRDWTPHSVFDV